MIHFSVIIPTYDRPEKTAQCLHALARGNYPKSDFEVILVDDGSHVAYEDFLAPIGNDLTITRLRQSNAGPAAARNLGARSARGDFLAFVDDDCLPSPDWLTNMSRAAAIGPEQMLGGNVVNGNRENPYCRAGQLILDVVYSGYESDPSKVYFFTTNNMVLSRESFLEMEGFNPAMRTSEDREFCDRWLSQGKQMRFVPNAEVVHFPELDGKQYIRRYFSYGRGDFDYSRSPSLRKTGIMRQTLGHCWRVLQEFLKIVRRSSPWESFQLLALLIVWQGATVAGFLWEAGRSFGGNRKFH